MTIKFKKRIMVLGTALFMGATAFTSYAATNTYLLSGNYADAGVWGSANINSSAFSYGGGLVGEYSDAASGTFKFKRSDGSKTYADKKLNKDYKTVATTTKATAKADKNGLTLTVQLSGEKAKSATISTE